MQMCVESIKYVEGVIDVVTLQIYVSSIQNPIHAPMLSVPLVVQ